MLVVSNILHSYVVLIVEHIPSFKIKFTHLRTVSMYIIFFVLKCSTREFVHALFIHPIGELGLAGIASFYCL